ncbi:aspartyl protease family protein [Streptomyces sp. NPDC127079]|uniref:aspartyl protease family protein n=1 Tax=Streptomyces sp. NPDC127079 TaxID=3347132 RepID=UPI0036689145
MLSTKRRAFEYMALVDSGADVNVFDVEIAIALGLNLKAGEAADIVTVMGGVETVYFHPITITVGGTRIETRVAFRERASDYGVVGQNGFFDHFIISFDRQAEELEIKRLLGSGAGEP